MRKEIAFVAVLTAILTVSAFGQDVRLLTHPTPPPRDMLNRLNLTIAWQAKLPTDGVRDGFFSLQLIPGKKNPHIVAQTFSGKVNLLDAETGDVLWRVQVGVPYWPGKPVAANDGNLFVVRRNMLYVLNRATGAQRVYTVDKETKLPDYGMRLEFGPSSAPTADEAQLFFVMGDRILCFVLPDWDAFEKGTLFLGDKEQEISKEERQSLLEKRSALAPLLLWSKLSEGTFFEQPPLLTLEEVSALSTNGHVLSFKRDDGKERFDFQTVGNISTDADMHRGIAYLGSEDFTLYALNLKSGQLVWRFLSGAPIGMKPHVNDKDVFVVSGKRGLFRLDRDVGHETWLNRDAENFLATNGKLVYALDRTGLFLILDHARGTTLAHYDMRDWNLHIANEWTDRIYLASHDGQILCLRHKDFTEPARLRSPEPRAVKKEEKKELKREEPVEEKKEEPKEEKKDIKDKDKEKDKDADKMSRLRNRPGTRIELVSAVLWNQQPGVAAAQCGWFDRRRLRENVSRLS